MKILLLFIGVVFIALALIKIYAYRILRKTFIFVNHKILLALLVFGLYGTEVMFFISVKESNFNHLTYIALSSSVIFGYSLFIACLIGDMLKRVGKFTLKKIESKRSCTQDFIQDSKSPNQDYALDSTNAINLKRRRFLKILLDLGIVALFFIFSFKSVRNAISIPKVRDVKIHLKGLKSQKTIAMISDVHIGKTLQADFLKGVVEKINALNADIVVIVGDLVDENIEFIKDHLLIVNELQSKEGVYYVSGNHEYYHGIDSTLEFLKTLNLKVLENENIELEGFNLAGVNDLAGEIFFKKRPPDLESAKLGLNPQKPSILLAHQPKFVRRNDVSDFDLVLSGHTHAGQVFPFSFFVWLDQHYIHGLYKLDSKTQLYVSSGAGFWGPAIRFLAPSEIAHITLKPQIQTT